MQQFILIENIIVYRSFFNLSPCAVMRSKKHLLTAGNPLEPKLPLRRGNAVGRDG